MRCKTFSVSLDSEAALEEERKIEHFTDAYNVKRIFASVANQPGGPVWSVLFFYEGEAPVAEKTAASSYVAACPERQPSKPAIDTGTPLTSDQVKSIIALKKWRADQAALEGVPLYMVAQNKWLEEIVQMPGRTLEDLKNVRGLGEWRVQKYGNKILEILHGASAARRSWPASSYSAGRA